MDKGTAAGILGVGVAIAIGVAFLSPLASGDPDGLERVAEDEGFIETAEDAWYEILPDYTIPGVDNEAASTVIAGVVGVVVVGGSVLLLAQIRRRGDSPDPPELTEHA